MKDKTKMYLCVIGLMCLGILGATLEYKGYIKEIGFICSMILLLGFGFGWYARGIKEKK